MAAEDESGLAPIFLDHMPENATENPFIAGLMDIKWAGMTPTEIALKLKDEGNFHFKEKDKESWITAEGLYCDALMQEGIPADLRSTLLCNRAAVRLRLGGKRDSLVDATDAIAANPTNMKAYYRAATAALELKEFENAEKFCTRALHISPGDVDVRALKEKIVKAHSESVAAAAAAQAKKDAAAKKHQAIVAAATQRNITIGEPLFKEHMQYDGEPALDAQGSMTWPVILLYPEFSQTDYIREVHEMHAIYDHVQGIFPPNEAPAPWDERGAYVADKLQLFIPVALTSAKPRFKKIPVNASLLDVLRTKDYVVPGVPMIYVVVSGSAYRTSFLEAGPMQA